MLDEINHCNLCGENVSLLIPQGDNRERHVCGACGEIHYQNPKVVCGCVPVWRERVLLCRRAIEPRYGFWTLPAGFLENGESLQAGAARETVEEAGAEVVEQELYAIYSLPTVSRVYVMFRAQLTGEDAFSVGEESLEVQLFDEADIPWDEIAFPVIRRTLERYFAERASGVFPVAVESLE